MSILKRNGIPGPEPHLLFGNLFHGIEGKNMIDKQKFLIEKYGRVVGYYTGARLNVLVADPELAKLIEVKDFDSFPDRSIYIRYQHPSPRADGAITICCGSKWKQIRNILSPTFSATRLKSMVPLVEESIQSFLRVVEKYSKSGQEFNIHEPYLKLAAQSLVSAAFGLKADLQNDPNNEFMFAAKQYVASKVNKFVFIVFTCFPQLQSIIHLIRGFIDTIGLRYHLTPIGVLFRMIYEIISVRKRNPTFRPKDLMQSMLDSELTSEDMSAINNGNNGLSSQHSNRLTEDEILSNCIVIFAAGYETTSSALAYTTHFLVNYPEIQERVRREVQELYEREGILDYNTVTELKYMEWVFNESLRMYPPLITGSTRECLEDYEYKDMIIPKGASVSIATFYLHHDPQLWNDPEVFDPMRFSPERKQEIHPYSWQPFGDGPRNCIGAKFAYLIMKMSLAKLLLKYRLEMSANTEVGTISNKFKMLTISPKNGVYIKVNKLT